MKKIILIILGMLLMASFSFASPFLVCDPYQSEVGVIKFTGTIDGQSFETGYSLHSTGAAIIYDMTSLDMTVIHSFANIRACNAIGCSDPAVSFVSPTKPSPPLNLRFSE